MSDGTPLGALLIAEGLLTEAQLDAALAEQAADGQAARPRCSSRHGTISEADLVRTLAAPGRPRVRRPRATASVDAVGRRRSSPSRWPAATRRCRSGGTDGRLVVAMADPSNVFAVDDIRSITGADVQTVVATAAQIHRRDRPLPPARRRRRRRSAQAATDDADDDDDLAQRQRGRRGRADRQVRQPAHHARRCRTARRTSTSSRPSTTCASATASTACCTR